MFFNAIRKCELCGDIEYFSFVSIKSIKKHLRKDYDYRTSGWREQDLTNELCAKTFVNNLFTEKVHHACSDGKFGLMKYVGHDMTDTLKCEI